MIIKDFMDYQSLGVPMEYKFFPVPSLWSFEGRE
jgi:hypothetical protein